MKINGIDVKDHDLIVLKSPPISKPAKRVNRIIIPGRSGTITEWRGDYDTTVKAVEFYYAGSDLDEVMDFISKAETVAFDTDSEFTYDARAEGKIEAERGKAGDYRIIVDFVCQPLKYKDPIILDGATSYTVDNPGTEPARANYIITGAGEQTLTVAGQVLTIDFAGGGETLTIDTLNELVYDEIENSAWGKIDGELPIIPTGENIIISTTGTALTVHTNWRWT